MLRWLGAIVSIVVTFVLAGSLATRWAYEFGQQDAHRWAHMVQPAAVSPNLLAVQTTLWFVGAGVGGGLAGLLLYYIFTGRKSKHFVEGAGWRTIRLCVRFKALVIPDYFRKFHERLWLCTTGSANILSQTYWLLPIRDTRNLNAKWTLHESFTNLS